jgi:hypothetical protein
MGGTAPKDKVCIKGPVPFCLDQASVGRGARARLEQLRDAIRALEDKKYVGLQKVFRDLLFVWEGFDQGEAKSIAEHLKVHWFDANSREAYFPGQKPPVVETYAEGLLQTLELSLYGAPDPVPINAWWVLDHKDKVVMANLATVDRGVTVSDNVTLLILTPRPPDADKAPPVILRNNWARAWITDSG